MSRPTYPPQAIEAFVTYLHTFEEGTLEEFAAFCDKHSEWSGELRELHAHWQHAEAVVARLQGQRPLQEAVADRLGADHDASITLDPPPENVDSPSDSHRLLKRENAYSRYRTLREIARGGMGVVSKVWDDDLRRNLAMKVIKKGSGTAAEDPAIAERRFARFLEEAQITGQLAHPGVVPVYDLGIDDRGRIYYTMHYVKGHDLRHIIELAESGKEGWNPTRVLSVLLRVCEAMAYAHSKNVIHRDLKPSNIMVGRYGQVYVMDWGLARVLGREDTRDVRVKSADRSQTSIRTDRHRLNVEDSESPLYTMDGDVLGTPAFMSPEQARGEADEVGVQTDVYSIGAMLYSLLSGQRPYTPADARVSPYGVWLAVIEGPPRAVSKLRPDAPAELVAICEKAMARQTKNRYPSVEALGHDLRAYLEHRVVHAYETGASAELRKWIVRNKALAATGAAAILLTIAGLGTTSYVEAKGRRVAENEQQKLVRIAEGVRATGLISKQAELWPPEPGFEPEYRAWLTEADSLSQSAAEARAIADELAPGGEPPTNADEARYYGLLLKLLETIGPLEPGGELYTSVEARLAFASTIRAESVSGPRARAAWEEAIAAIADEHSQYGGLVIEPQLGLLPLGEDPSSGLWEFAHLQSGRPPTRNASGQLECTEEMGIVLVLLPPGAFFMGAQRLNEGAINYDPYATALEGPVTRVEVSAFFASKYEVTQAQWERVVGPREFRYSGDGYSGLHPVESVTWQDCQTMCARTGLTLPTEEQWEYAARAGAPWLYWSGAEASTVEGKENVLDESAVTFNVVLTDRAAAPFDFNDAYATTSPVGSFSANRFGLHDVLGNVSEWCQNLIYTFPDPELGIGRRVTEDGYATRGGSFVATQGAARTARRIGGGGATTYKKMDLGLRPVRELER